MTRDGGLADAYTATLSQMKVQKGDKSIVWEVMIANSEKVVLCPFNTSPHRRSTRKDIEISSS